MKKNLIVFLFLGINFYSCQKDKEEVLVEASKERRITSETNYLIRNYAKILAVSIADQEMRRAIKEEAMVKFDGDYNILAHGFEKRILPNRNICVGNLLRDTHSLLNENYGTFKSSSNEDSYFEMVNKKIPNLQISVPVNCDNWDVENYEPLVVYLPYDFDDSKERYVLAFDKDGNTHQLSLDKEPELPVIVVGISERIDVNGKKIGIESQYFDLNEEVNNQLKNTPSFPVSLTLAHGPAQSVILQWSDVENETGYEVWRMHEPGEFQFWPFAVTGQNQNVFVNNWIAVGAKVWYKVCARNSFGLSAFSPIMATTVSARNDGEWLKVKRMKFTKSALGAVESWVYGAPELRLRVIKGSESGASVLFTSGRIEPGKRSDIEDKWWFFEFPLFSWTTSVVGTVLTFDWQEEDNMTVKEWKVTGSYEAKALGGEIKAGGEITFQIDNSGAIGNTNVLFWHEKAQTYNLTGFEWIFVY